MPSGTHPTHSHPLGWTTRGWIDRLSGGPGLARGRRDPDRLLQGDSLDWWRVEAIEDGARLRLRAEMLLPGLAWLEFSVGSAERADRSLLRQRGSIRAAPPVTRTGGRCGPSTAWSSAACCATS